MKKWRPKGWHNPYLESQKEGCYEGLCFERGADTLLEAICKEVEKELLADEEMLDAADRACDESEKEEGGCETGDSCMDCRLREKAVAQAQLNKILSLLGGKDGS